jgi:hypothetical protein
MQKSKLTTAAILAAMAIVGVELAAGGQNKSAELSPKPAPNAIAARIQETEKFYFHSWGKDEYKVCQTYSGVPNVVLCDSADDIEWKSSFMNLLANNNREGKTEEQAYIQALNFASAHGKAFPASFSGYPWPKPQTGFKLTVWNCSKDKTNTISCDVTGLATKPAPGE